MTGAHWCASGVLAGRSGQGIFGGDPIAQTPEQCLVGHDATRVIRPFSGGPFLPKGTDHTVRADVRALLTVARPTAVLGGVVAVVVDAVNAQIVAVAIGERPITEGLKALIPGRADADATPTVAGIVAVRGAGASFPHPSPDVVEPGPVFAMRGPKSIPLQLGAMGAATRAAVAAEQLGGPADALSPAIAADPHTLNGLRTGGAGQARFGNNPTAEPHANGWAQSRTASRARILRLHRKFTPCGATPPEVAASRGHSRGLHCTAARDADGRV